MRPSLGECSRGEDLLPALAQWMGRAALGALVLIYAAGCFELKARVREACTHGNCRHGFYSKYTKAEQAAFYAWAFGYPWAALAAVEVGRALREPPTSRRLQAHRAPLFHIATVLALSWHLLIEPNALCAQSVEN
jgi:hypothetical protein